MKYYSSIYPSHYIPLNTKNLNITYKPSLPYQYKNFLLNNDTLFN